jgi:dienelactone hydrolase
MKRALYALLSVLALAPLAGAEVRTKTIEYEHGELVLEGLLVWDDAQATSEKRAPGVLVCHEWWGCDAYAKKRAEQLARMGYVAFALDLYGRGRTTGEPTKAKEWSGALYADPETTRARAALGLAQLTAQPMVDPARCAAIGYCMGGTIALELARTGAELRGVVAFHASVISATGNDEEALAQNKKIRATLTICHGQDDAFVQPEEIARFHAQMKAAGVDYQLLAYAGAVHSFTNPGADAHKIPGVAYQAKADQRSWEHMRAALAEAFGSG